MSDANANDQKRTDRGLTPAKQGSANQKQANTQGKVLVRHYCQGIGDCHLLRFTKPDGKFFWMLIDCGIHPQIKGYPETMAAIVKDIAAQTKKLDVVVGTHEHTDHLSGFFSEAETFKNIKVGEVWLAWTENPEDPQAKKLDTFKEEALNALQLVSMQLDRASGLSENLAALHNGLGALLSFQFGVKGERVRAQRNALVALATSNVRYFEPGDPPIVLADLPGVRVYVLGPPRDEALLRILDREKETYTSAAGFSPLAKAISSAFSASGEASGDMDEFRPFDINEGADFAQLAEFMRTEKHDKDMHCTLSFARDHYFGPTSEPSNIVCSRPPSNADDPNAWDQSWRRIDHDWLGIGADLAIQLDRTNNNTSLVLAFEFTDTGRVLLFAGDAQVGNWLSWHDASWDVDGKQVTGPDLLARTVYYKVGHHGSGNATLKQKGLDLMKHPDLAAFIPTSEKDAHKLRWHKMPLPSLFEALQTSCQGRVARADDAWISGSKPEEPFETPSGAIQAQAVRDEEDGLWVEYEVG